MTETDTGRLLELADQFADALDEQADERRQRAINARAEKAVMGSEADEWAVSFGTAYQTLRGIAAAVREVATEIRAHAASTTGEGL